MSSPICLPVIVISPSASYRRALVDTLTGQHGILVEANGARAADVAATQPGLNPSVAIVDGGEIPDIPVVRATWPATWILCLLDYLGDWEQATSHGADSCVLKEQGASPLMDSIAYINSVLAPPDEAGWNSFQA